MFLGEDIKSLCVVFAEGCGPLQIRGAASVNSWCFAGINKGKIRITCADLDASIAWVEDRLVTWHLSGYRSCALVGGVSICSTAGLLAFMVTVASCVSGAQEPRQVHFWFTRKLPLLPARLRWAGGVQCKVHANSIG